MWTNVLSAALLAWVRLHALLPTPVLYRLSSILYVIIYRVARYRIKVVRRNMQSAFPDKSPDELRGLEREFYRHFADYIMETIRLAHISQRELLERAVIENPEVALRLMEEGHRCLIFMLGHYGNWEWFTGAAPWFGNRFRLYQVYRPLSNKAFDRLFLSLRSRFGARGIAKNNIVREVIKLAGCPTGSIVILLADQTPSKANLHYWTSFLNQDTAMLTGAERIARKMCLPVIYADVHKKVRGRYIVHLDLITANSADTDEYWITEQYTRRMEQTILRDPAGWLWTHKRWKYTRNSKQI